MMNYSTRSARLVLSLALLGLTLFATLPARPAAAQDASQFFPETGHAVSDAFLRYWQQNGGLPIFGYPLSDAQQQTSPTDGKTYLTQWFERARMELHPEFGGTIVEGTPRFDVQLGLLGREVTPQRQNEAPFQPIAPFTSTPDRLFFPETGHSLAPPFSAFWQNNGGLPIFGFPISEAFEERNPVDGQVYQVQYTERARFEYHPNAAPGSTVQLGLLGSQLYGNTPPPAPQAGTIDVTANGITQTVLPNQTVVVPPATSSVTIAVHGTAPFDPAAVRVTLAQPATPNAWQVTYSSPRQTPNTWVFTVRGASDRNSYFQAALTYGSGNPPVIVGVQVDNMLIGRPNLTANWTDPAALVQSFYNAINRREYERAFSYWETPGASNAVSANFADFVNGYSNTVTAQVTTGTVQTGSGAGNIFAAVPVALQASLLNGGEQRFYGCYLLHQVNVPQNDAVPPFPLFLRAAHIFAADPNADPAALLQQANQFVQSGQCTE